MEKLKTIFNQYFWLFVLAWLLLVAAFVYWLAGAYEEHKTESGIRQTQTEVNSSLNASSNFQKQAGEISVDRQVEDGLREKVLQPKLDESRRRSKLSKINLDRAQRKYNEKTIPHDSDLSYDCRRLANLFPDRKFEYCR